MGVSGRLSTEMIALGRLTLLSVAFVAGCGSDAAPASDPSLPEVGSSGDRTVEALPIAGTVLPPVLYASFVAETTAGEGPALVTFQNDTKNVMSFWLGQAEFIAVPSGWQVGPELSASAAVETDTSTGKHMPNGACVKFPMAKFVGPPVLDPGQGYFMVLALDLELGFVGTLTEAAAPPFVGLRAKVFDPSSDSFNPSRLRVELVGSGPARSTPSPLFTTYDENRTSYKYVGEGPLAAELTFSSGSGQRYAGDPVEVSGAPGYTVVVDDESVADAAAVVTLDEILP